MLNYTYVFEKWGFPTFLVVKDRTRGERLG